MRAKCDDDAKIGGGWEGGGPDPFRILEMIGSFINESNHCILAHACTM